MGRAPFNRCDCQVEDLQAQAEDALAKLEKDPQAVHSTTAAVFSCGGNPPENSWVFNDQPTHDPPTKGRLKKKDVELIDSFVFFFERKTQEFIRN